MAQTDFDDPGCGDLLITGATGFLGATVVRRLLAAGCAPERLRCLVRDERRALAAGLPAVSLRRGELGTANGIDALRAAAAGATTVLHLAGTLKAQSRSEFDRVNVVGTTQLLDAVATAARSAHVVMVSSLAAAGPSINGATSALPPAQCRPVSWYGASKLGGELALVGGAMPWTILRPPVVYGPGDAATRLLFRQAIAPLTAAPLVSRPLSAIHVDDVATAVLLTLRQRPHGVVLPLDGPERTDTHSLLRAIAKACGRRARLVPMPMPLAGFAAVLADAYGRLRGGVGFFNRDKVREIRAVGWVADGEAAQRCLGFTPAIHLADGLAAVARAEGLVRPRRSSTAGSVA